MVKLSIVVPTIGRDTLRSTLLAITEQMNENDELIVVADSYHDSSKARFITNQFSSDGVISFTECAESGVSGYNYGNYQRNKGLELATGTHIALIDDDDVHTADALELFREQACDVPVIFQMHYEGHFLLWKIKGLLECGNFGTPCFLVPRVDPMPKFGMHYAGDADFIIDACKQIGDPVWCRRVVAEIRPHERPNASQPGATQ